MALSQEEIDTLTARLQLYYAAETAILRNQSYEMPDGRKLARTDLKTVTAEIDRIRRQLQGGSSTPTVVGRARRGIVVAGR